MGTIWQGYDTVLDRFVAIKQIRSDQHRSVELRQELADRFRREARVTAKIEHPGVPAVYDAAIDRDTDDVDQLYLVMQLVRGVTVADLLAEQGPLPVDWAASIAAQVCAVLSYAHAIPVVHRDLKPSNVMVDHTGHVKVLDFGVAAVLGTDVTQLTVTGRLIGSRDYMSPEQFHGVGVSPRSDLYALGCLLHEMLAGRKVFDGNRDAALQHVHDRPTPLRALRSELDTDLERLVLDLLAKAPEQRPSSAGEVFDRLVPFLPGPAGGAGSGPDSGPGLGSGTGTGNPDSRAAAAGMPDPTRPYRQPTAPRREPEQPVPPRVIPRSAGPGMPRPASPERSVQPELPARLAERLDAAEDQAGELIEDERFAQAVGILDDLLASADVRPLLGLRRLLDLRSTHAAALFLGGDFRRALTAFDELAAAYKAVLGAGHELVFDCRKQAAYCHVELGDIEAALTAFGALLDQVGRGYDNQHPEALELRRQVGILLLAANRVSEAAIVLRPLHEDLVAVRGSEDPATWEVRDLLTRIGLTCDYQP